MTENNLAPINTTGTTNQGQEQFNFKFNALDFSKYKLKSEVGVGGIILSILIWFILIIVTFGLASIVFQYYLYKNVVNKTYIVEKETNLPVARLQCNLDIMSMLGYILLYLVLALCTFGLAFLVFMYKSLTHVLSATTIVPLEPKNNLG
ncbi:DUF6693 family protein [Psittacicella gerlachiana]|uniref:Uncharacterized protein n=1 Tax=Psittacicella gerlachiana TaxID=2028574 RepID=A0A3A1YAM5_9GAMM|nr:DUF6693 family protein [Psittacicella gerlachiana]RIY34279.1 hypothetical protein CKF59_05715 [Psittacicella gerlachiana]